MTQTTVSLRIIVLPFQKVNKVVCVSVSFQIFASIAGECPGWRGKLSGRGNVRVRICPRENVLHALHNTVFLLYNFIFILSLLLSLLCGE